MISLRDDIGFVDDKDFARKSIIAFRLRHGIIPHRKAINGSPNEPQQN